MNQSYRRPGRLASLRRNFRRLFGGWFWLVWLGLCALTLLLYLNSPGAGGGYGEVLADLQTPAPLAAARLLAVEVRPGDRVQPGQVLARLDARLAESEAALADAQWSGSAQRLTETVLQADRQFNQAVGALETDLQTARINRDRDAAELAALRVLIKEKEALLARKLIPASDLDALRPRIAALETAQAAYAPLLAGLDQRLAEAGRDQAALRQWLGAGQPGPAAEALKTQESKSRADRAFVDSRRTLAGELGLLRAAAPGVVSDVLFRPGDVVPAGAPVVRVLMLPPRYVSWFVPEIQMGLVQPGRRFELVRLTPGNGGGPWPAVVDFVAPEIQARTNQFFMTGERVLRGRRTVLRIEGAHDLLPGETVSIRAATPLRDWWRALWRRPPTGAAGS